MGELLRIYADFTSFVYRRGIWCVNRTTSTLAAVDAAANWNGGVNVQGFKKLLRVFNSSSLFDNTPTF